MEKHFEVKQSVAIDLAEMLMGSAGRTQHCGHRARRFFHHQDSPVHSAYLVDTRHPNGLEVHVVLANAEVHIFNVRSGNLVTMLFARPNQIRRYGIHSEVLLALALDNLHQGRNSL